MGAIDRACVMVLIFSGHANESKQVHREVQRACERGLPVVPFRIENITPEKALAYYMGSVQWLDALTQPFERHLGELARVVQRLLEERLNTSATEAGSRADMNTVQQTSPLRISIREEGPYVDVPKGGPYGLTRRLKIELRNVDRSKAISGCKAQITEILPYSGYRGPWIVAQDIVLAAGDQTYLPIVQYGEALDKKKYDCADTMIEVCCTGKAPLLQIEEENILTIRATAHDVPFHEIQCAVWVDRSGKLRIRELELAKDDEMSLLEAATQAYERTRGHAVAGFAEGRDSTPEQVLSWYCYGLIIPRESLGQKPLMKVFGMHPPSRVKELIAVRPSYIVSIRPRGVYLMEAGRDVFSELTVCSSELPAAIETMKGWADLEG
jgi:hypothetical protein